MIEYICSVCDYSEFEVKIIPMKKCPHCGKLLNAEEELSN